MAKVKEIIANTKMEMEINGDNKFYSYILTDILKAHEEEIAEKDKEIAFKDRIIRNYSDFIENGECHKNKIYKEDFEIQLLENQVTKSVDERILLKDNSKYELLKSKEEKEDE